MQAYELIQRLTRARGIALAELRSRYAEHEIGVVLVEAGGAPCDTGRWLRRNDPDGQFIRILLQACDVAADGALHLRSGAGLRSDRALSSCPMGALGRTAAEQIRQDFDGRCTRWRPANGSSTSTQIQMVLRPVLMQWTINRTMTTIERMPYNMSDY